MSVNRKIIRLKNDYFANSQILKKLKIDDVVFPDILTAQKVESLFNFPKANNVKSFIECRSKLISIRIQYDTQMRYRVCDFIDEDGCLIEE